MKVYIVGAGSVGRFLGETLSRVNVEVVYAPRKLEDVVPYDADVAIVATKSFDTPGAIATLRAAIVTPEKCVFVTPQNGVGNEELLAEAFGARNVMAAALTVPVETDRDGRVGARNTGGLALAPMADVAYNWLVATFGSAGLQTTVVSDWRALKWSKLALNVVANASCAILNVLPNRLVAFDHIFTLEIHAVREVRDVMRAMKITPIDLPRYPVRALLGIASLPSPVAKAILSSRVSGGRGTKPPSLLLDIRAGKSQTEVDMLNGAVAAAGSRLGIPTPVNAVYARVLSDIANMPQLWPKYRERPEALEGEVMAEVQRQRSLRKHKA